MRILAPSAIASALLIACPAPLAAQGIERLSLDGPEDEPAPRSAAEANMRVIPGPPIVTVEPSIRPGGPDTIITTYPGNLVPPPPSSFNREYPPCGPDLQDNCRNAGDVDPPDGSWARDFLPEDCFRQGN